MRLTEKNFVRLFYNASVVKNRMPSNFNVQDATLFKNDENIALPRSGLFLLKNVFVTDLGIIYKNFSPIKENIVCYASDFKNYSFRYLVKSFLKFKKLKYSGHKCLIIFDNYSGPNGFAHWICDGLTRLAEMNDSLSEYTLVVPEYFKQQKIYSDSLQLFNVSTLHFLPKDSLTFFNELHLPTPIGDTGNFHPENVKKLKALVKAKIGVPGTLHQNLYISRAKANRRFVQNEKEVVAMLEKYNFKTIYLEDYSFTEQIKIMGGANNIVSIHGAGLAMLLFAEAKASVLELRSKNDAINNMYYLLANVCNLNYYYLNCTGIENSKTGNNFDLYVDLAELEMNVSQMITKG